MLQWSRRASGLITTGQWTAMMVICSCCFFAVLGSASSSSDTSFRQRPSNMHKQRFVFDLFHHYVVSRPSSSSSPRDQSEALVPVPGHKGKGTAYKMLEHRPNVQVTRSALRHLVRLIPDTPEFTILTSIKVHSTQPTASILSFTSEDDNKILLGVDYHAKRKELRLHYVHSGHSHTEPFPVDTLEDRQWHKLSVTLTTNFVQLFIDCELVFERQIPSVDLIAMAGDEDGHDVRNMRLWLAQRNGEGKAQFQGAMEYVKIAMYAQGFLEQCPHANVACPTCSQFHGLERFVHDLHSHIEALHDKLVAAESRISDLEQCECMNSCEVDGTHFRDGESWHPNQCTTCTCRGGEVTCEEPKCPELTCRNPVTQDGDCCPSCLRDCIYRDNHYENGEGFSVRDCFHCTCKDGLMICGESKKVCPPLNCPEENQISTPEQCCKFCLDADYCDAGNDCHPNARCVNMKTRFTCKCNEGYFGDGWHCEDKDECATEGSHCLEHSDCVNELGSYHCDCHPGFTNTDEYTCQEIDECAENAGICGDRAQCINTVGSYLCGCLPGYEGTPLLNCTPVCSPPCESGGECISPEVCSCPIGFEGPRCEKDIDECATNGGAQCHNNSECLNLPGSYQCQCRPGFYSLHPNNQRGSLCFDVDECLLPERDDLCPKGTTCRNLQGSYRCECRDPSACHSRCKYHDRTYSDGQSWPAKNDRCLECSCEMGQYRCSRLNCDCRGSGASDPCCRQQCSQQCQHQSRPELSFHSGETWTYQCQTCQCTDGETDCWQVQCPQLSCSPTVLHEGDCCPRCAQEDICSVQLDSRESAPGAMCYFNGEHFQHRKSWRLKWNACVECICQDGEVCCSEARTCSEPNHGQRQLNRLQADEPANAASLATGRSGSKNSRRRGRRKNPREKRLSSSRTTR